MTGRRHARLGCQSAYRQSRPSLSSFLLGRTEDSFLEVSPSGSAEQPRRIMLLSTTVKSRVSVCQCVLGFLCVCLCLSVSVCMFETPGKQWHIWVPEVQCVSGTQLRGSVTAAQQHTKHTGILKYRGTPRKTHNPLSSVVRIPPLAEREPLDLCCHVLPEQHTSVSKQQALTAGGLLQVSYVPHGDTHVRPRLKIKKRLRKHNTLHTPAHTPPDRPATEAALGRMLPPW